MVAVKLLRTVGVLEEEYGRIRFDGRQFYYDRLSSVFVKYLQSGVSGPDHKRYRPEHGIQFLKHLKNQFSNSLRVSDFF